jgi:sterol desaturase/sphingolipid hydroxylase (fatty acid hydroxylase superfamily)
MEALYKPLLGLWVPLLGFHPAVMAAIGAFVLIVGQFHHTELYRRPTVLDRVFVTPSTHRVHHGSNAAYLDKNFGSMLVIWDRLFGTYVPETEPVVYGLTGNKHVSSPRAALVGGYADLIVAMRSLDARSSLRVALARP